MKKQHEEFDTFGFLLNKYNKMVLTLDEIGAEINRGSRKAMLGAIGNGTFPLKTRIEGGMRVADVRDVADYLDEQRNAA